jgi:hypothetical protein
LLVRVQLGEPFINQDGQGTVENDGFFLFFSIGI